MWITWVRNQVFLLVNQRETECPQRPLGTLNGTIAQFKVGGVGGINLDADKSRTHKSYKVRGCNLGLHDDMEGFFTSSAENYRKTTLKTAGEEEKKRWKWGQRVEFCCHCSAGLAGYTKGKPDTSKQLSTDELS